HPACQLKPTGRTRQMIIKIDAEQVVPGSPRSCRSACPCHDPSTPDSGCTLTPCHLRRWFCIEGRITRIRAACCAGCLPLADALPVLPRPGPDGTASISAEAAGRASQPFASRVGGLGWQDAVPPQLFPWVRYYRHRLCRSRTKTNAPAHTRTGNLDASVRAASCL